MFPNLPDVRRLHRTCKAIAMLDAILSPEWQYRYYSFNSKWSSGQEMASMRDGCGDGYFILFNNHGAILKGYAHEAAAAKWIVDHGEPLPGMFDGVPQVLNSFLREPAFTISDTTFSLWRTYEDSKWRHGSPRYPAAPDPAGAIELLSVLAGDPEFYGRWARDYFEVPVDISVVRHVFGNLPLSEELIKRLNPNLTLAALAGDIAEIGYSEPG